MDIREVMNAQKRKLDNAKKKVFENEIKKREIKTKILLIHI